MICILRYFGICAQIPQRWRKVQSLLSFKSMSTQAVHDDVQQTL